MRQRAPAMTKDEKALRDHGVSLPEATEDLPWSERALKVRGKVFALLHRVEDGLSVTVKLPQSGHAVVLLPHVKPSGDGLGRAGWVSARFPAGERLPTPTLRAWLDESYRAVAPKAMVKQRDGVTAPVRPKARSRRSPR